MEKSIFLNGRGFILNKITNIEGSYYHDMNEFIINFELNGISYRSIQIQIYNNNKYTTSFILYSLPNKKFNYSETDKNGNFSNNVNCLIDELLSIIKIKKITI